MPHILRLLLAALLAAAAVPAAGQQSVLPALYDVAGVASDDALNVRSGPSASDPVIGTLAPDARGVEVVALNAAGTWGQVNMGEGSGWASMAFLARQPGQDGSALPVPLYCSGTEPFWSLNVTETGIRFEGLDIQAVETSLATRTAASGIPGRYGFNGWGQGGGSAIHGVVRRESCSDGMSDRAFGFSLDTLVQPGSGLTQYAGCCRLQR